MRTILVAHTSFEAGEAPAADLHPRELEITNAECPEFVLAVVVAMHAKTRQIERSQRADPVRPQVAERDDGVGMIALGKLGRIRTRRLVGEGEHAHRRS